MRSTLKMVLLALLAVLAVSATSVSVAFASPEWYVKKGGVYSKLATSVKVKFENKIEFLDAGEIGFKCEAGTAEGEIKTGGAGVISEFSVNERDKCEGIKRVGPSHLLEVFTEKYLPWTTELYKEGTEIRQRDAGSSGEKPGIEFRVGGDLDTCKGVTSTHMTTNATAGLVEASFDTKSGKMQCSWSNEEAGEWKGVMKIAPTSTEKSKGVEAIKVE